ncbi:hypothetical protein [Brumimicrobium aurantiacum]|uniref:Lipoprotein n=1 Tax=Brumimicrobium aurantiacum TaxID=1737063 RepID=A0A3E1EZI4_9FLAO|nr:hypothetical protein [Brumimicrobium aurantiacum]RFC54867.1 hypothetical protein DXU93_03335 [Brumimicrobium aurantiacum]
MIIKLLWKFKIVIIFLLFVSCASSSKINSLETKIIQIENEELKLFSKADTNSLIANTIKKGTILFLSSEENDYQEVYTRNPKYISQGEYEKYRYYLHKSKYKSITSNYYSLNAKLIELPFDPKKVYLKGSRGGCYYINSNNNKQYVNRNYCDGKITPQISKPKKSKSYSSTCGARTQSGGYCKRKVSGGGRCYQH